MLEKDINYISSITTAHITAYFTHPKMRSFLPYILLAISLLQTIQAAPCFGVSMFMLYLSITCFPVSPCLQSRSVSLPIGSGSPPTGKGSLLTGSGSLPIGRGSPPTRKGSPPTGNVSLRRLRRKACVLQYIVSFIYRSHIMDYILEKRFLPEQGMFHPAYASHFPRL